MSDTTIKSPQAPAAQASPWAPFRIRAFALLWTATLISNIGTWMNDVGAGWLMTTLSPSPLMVSLVQAATMLPMFLFALPAGALADIVDKRKLLIILNTILGLVAALFAVLVYADAVDMVTVLIFTFLLGTGAAFVAPAWQSIVPKLVPREQLQSAVALNSIGINVSRAVGPTIAGVLIAAVGIYAPFALNAASFIVILVALLLWTPPVEKARVLPAESMGGAIRAGLRYAAGSSALKSTIIRAVAFFLFAGSYWALLPLIAKDVLSGGPELYGLLLGCLGGGAVGGAMLLPKIKAKLGANGTVAAGSAGTVVVLLVLALIPQPAVVSVALVVAGGCWIAVLSSLHVSAQTALPDWVRARGLSIFLTAFFGAMTLGAIVWGRTAQSVGIETALLIATAGLAIGVPLTRKWKLNQGASLDLAPSMHWPAPVLEADEHGDRGPVMITIEYQIDKADTDTFLDLISNELAPERRRDGAYDWGIMEDSDRPGVWVEYFLLASWLEHLRQHDRVTESDRAVQEKIRALHKGDEKPLVRHMLAPKR